jgi:hypothetical protein
MAEIDVLMAKAKGLRKAGMPMNAITKMLGQANGDSLLAMGLYEAQGCAVNVRGGPEVRSAWDMSYAKSWASMFELDENYEFVRKPESD